MDREYCTEGGARIASTCLVREPEDLPHTSPNDRKEYNNKVDHEETE
jgi:hypothetical protein